ncbi:hypothetical protein Tco_0540271 [Tanacetum coccineum]
MTKTEKTNNEKDLKIKIQRHTISIKIQESRKLKMMHKYEYVGQDTRSQDGKDDKDLKDKDLKISRLKTKSKDNDKGSRSKITKHEGTSLQQR